MKRPVNVLAIGAHPDDIELGCGGTLVRHLSRGDEVTMMVMTAGTNGPGEAASRGQEQERSAEALGVHHVVWGGFHDGDCELHQRAMLQSIERELYARRIDVVYVHSRHDSHQDHRAVALAALAAARKCSRVLAYQSPSALIDAFIPSVYVDISDAIDKKISALACHSSQVTGSPTLDLEAVRAQAIYRGFESRAGAAEAFMPIRYLLDV